MKDEWMEVDKCFFLFSDKVLSLYKIISLKSKMR